MNGLVNREQNGNENENIHRKGEMLLAFMVVSAVIASGCGILNRLNMQQGKADSNQSSTFYSGVNVDGIALGGLTREEAKSQIEAKQQQTVKTTGVTIIDVNNAPTRLLVSDLPKSAYAFDTDAVLDQAWAVGRNDQSAVNDLLKTPVNLQTALTVKDLSSFKQKVFDLTTPFYKAPQDAAFVSGSYDTTKQGIDRLSFTPDAPGQQVNPDNLWAAVQAEFVNRTYNDVHMALEEVPAAVKLADLKANLQLVQISPITAGGAAENKKLNDANVGHTYTTQIIDHSKPRLANIKLASDAVSGIVKPGEVFSMNQRTGNRTSKQGYQIAPIDKSGVVDKGLGGGVCQVSGTLYNAAVRYGGKYEVGGTENRTAAQPGLAITTRDSHSLPSAYLHTGTDATVDIGSGKDLKFRNDFDKPVVIFMYYEKTAAGEYFEHCDIYGPPLPDGATYDLVRKNGKILPADTTSPPKTAYSEYAIPGQPSYIEPRNGYYVEVYIEKNVQGKKTSSKLYTAKYDPQPAYYYIHSGETAPTPTPVPTPTPSPGVSPSPSLSPSPAAT